jgi:pantothenate synthetase|tara:strand:- start:226 stop:456 length:231 start_codon:yes stop_codon:yes gene_type:complete
VGAVRENVFDILKKRGVEQIEYVTVANVRTTKPMLDHEQLYHKEMEKEDNREDGHQYMIATAVKIGNTRLIDNIVC